MSVDEFVYLCTELKALGCAKVVADGWEAVFPVTAASLQTVTARPSAAPRDEKPTEFKTAEQLREEAYARELGKR